MWTVSWQDFRRHAYGDPMPPVQRATFTDKGAADRRKAELKSARVVVCVTPLVIRHRRQKPMLDGEGPTFNKNWKMAK